MNLKKLIKGLLISKAAQTNPNELINRYKINGRIPWSEGYSQYKENKICAAINDSELVEQLNLEVLPSGFGFKLDERIVEYLWIWSKLGTVKSKVLDAGSTFNFEFIVDNKVIKEHDLYIYTYAPESQSFTDRKVSYVYGDLREMPFRDNLFDYIVSQSTIEHIGMDNSIYGYEILEDKKSTEKSYEFMKAIVETIRILKSGGTALITFPYGKFENHGFFQQFDREMLSRISVLLRIHGTLNSTFFKYEKEGWNFAEPNELDNYQSYNPHTGRGKGDDGAAHCRSICCIEFIKR